MNSPEGFNSGIDTESEVSSQEISHDEEAAVSEKDPGLSKGELQKKILDLRHEIKHANSFDNESEVLRLESALRVAENDLKQADSGPSVDEAIGEHAPVAQEIDKESHTPYQDALLEQNILQDQITKFEALIKKAEKHDDNDEVTRLENLLRVAERDLEETKESIGIEEQKMQARARKEKKHGEAIEINKDFDQKNADWDRAIKENTDIDNLKMRNEAFVMDQEINAYKEAEDHKEAIKENREFEAHKENLDRDRETYEENRASSMRSLAFYRRDPQKIDRQKKLVESIDLKAYSTEVQNLRAEINAAEKEDGKNVHDEVNRLEALLREAEKMPSRREAEEAILMNMEKIFPSRDADAEKFVSRYWGNSLEEHEVARMEFEAEIQKMDNIEGLLNVIADWGAIPEGNKFLTNTKFREDLDAIFALSDENEKIRELENITKNDEVCNKLIELYRKEYEALTPVAEESEPSIPVEVGEFPKQPPKQKKKTLGMNQPNIETKKEWKPAGSPEMLAELKAAAAEEERLEYLNTMINSNRFHLFPYMFLATKKGREALRYIADNHIPMRSTYERETSAVIAAGLRLKAAKESRQRLEEKLGRNVSDNERRLNALAEFPAGRMVIPDATYHTPAVPKEQKRGNWFTRLFSRSEEAVEKRPKKDVTPEPPKRPYRRMPFNKDEAKF